MDVTRNRSMVPFYDLGQTALSLQTSQRETANIGLKMTSIWRLEAQTSTGTVDEPVTGSPNLQLKDTASTLALKYLGIAGLTTGVHVGYQSGEYSGNNTPGTIDPTYHQTTEGVDAEYTATGANHPRRAGGLQ